MFYGQCNDCGERWELGTASTCKCPDEELAKPDFWEGYLPEPVKCKYPKCSYPCSDLPDCRDAQQALDKKAENARELGLMPYNGGDYEPAQQCKWPTCQSEEYQQALAEQIKRELVGEQPAQQEPVAFLDWYDNAHWGNEDFKDGCWRAWDAALEHTSPFTLSLAQRQARSADTWVSLTDEEVRKTINDLNPRNSFIVASAIEAKLKEKNNG